MSRELIESEIFVSENNQQQNKKSYMEALFKCVIMN